MNPIIENSRFKLEEAAYFLCIMNKIETNNFSINKGYTKEKEYVFVLSAFLNACYSSTEMLRKEPSFESIVMALRQKRKDIYKYGSSGGWRTLNVHHKPVSPEHKGYIPPPGDNIIFSSFTEEKYTPPSGDAVNFCSKEKYYFTENSPQNSITDLCCQHLSELNTLNIECEQLLARQTT